MFKQQPKSVLSQPVSQTVFFVTIGIVLAILVILFYRQLVAQPHTPRLTNLYPRTGGNTTTSTGPYVGKPPSQPQGGGIINRSPYTGQ